MPTVTHKFATTSRDSSWHSIALLSFCIAALPAAFAATVATNGSASDVQSKINAATNGDTILLPSGGSFSWTSSVVLSTSKYVTLDLNGSTITLSGGGGEFRINPHATGINRVTNGTMVRGSGYNLYSGPFKIDDEPGTAGLRVDHITFSGSNVLIDAQGQGPALMDHCTISNLGGAQEFIHITGWGSGNTSGWSTSVTPGGSAMFFIEDCTFTTSSSSGNCSWIQGYYGCRVVIRYNTFNYVSVDMHGTAGMVGARWWECYNNVFNNTSSNNHSYAFSMRAGSGVIFGNSMKAGAGRTVRVGLCEEDSGYPALYQIGRGLNQSLDPAYVWNNGSIGLSVNDCDAPEAGNMVQMNRDVFASAKPGYTPYAYPHPLQSGGPAPVVPSTPSNLQAANQP